MYRMTAFIFATVLTWSSLFAQADDKRPMTVDDRLRFVEIRNILLSPDGDWVFYSKTGLDWERNGKKTSYYMVPANGGEAIQYIGDAGGESFQFSPDGKYLSFVRPVDDDGQLFLIPTSGGEAIQYSDHRGGLGSYHWAPNGKQIFFTAEEQLSDEEQKEHDLGADPVFIDEGPNGKNEGRWENFWVFNIETKQETRITNEGFLTEGFDISPDGNRLVFTARKENLVNEPFRSELYLADVRTKKVKRLTDNNSPESNPLWAPDGKTLIYQATKREDFYDLTNGFFWIMNPDTRKKRRIETEFYGRSGNLTWMPDGKSVLFNEYRKTNQNLFKMEISTGKVTPVTNITGSLVTYAFSKDRKKMVYTFSDFNTPKDIYSSSVKKFKPLRLTDANPWVKEEILLGKAEVISWKSKGGMEIEGLFYLPGDYKKGTKLPLIVYIHGGPQGVFSNSLNVYYSATTMDLHLYTGLGYAVLAPNVRGSSGYGDELLRGLIGEVGDGEYIDQMTGVDKLIEEGYVDPDQMGIRGSSWGGVSTSYTITQTQRFKAATIESGVTNWAAEVGPGFSFDLGLWYIGGKPWTNPEEWRDHSSITHVENITTPTLIVHGGEDQTSSVGQGLMLFTAIRDIGKAPVRYIKLPRQGHDFLEPRLSRIMTIEEVKWMQKYIRDIDWKPWERDSGL